MAGKIKTAYICSECGYSSPRWLGRCPGCSNWNTLTETVISDAPSSQAKKPNRSAASVKAKTINDITVNSETRYKTGIGELDRVLGGGIVKGSLILVGGDPGVGKSTLLLQICQKVGTDKKILYVSGEESEGQIKMRAERLGVTSGNLFLLSETDAETINDTILSMQPQIVIIDSIQTMHHNDIASASGSVPQVREATNMFMNIAKQNEIAMFIVGHVTKDGNLAGPRVLEHMVDCVLYFEGDRQNSFRILRCVKNRFGSTNEIGVFDMRNDGLAEVENPSAALLEGRAENCSGSAIVCVLEGTRCVLAEVQALVVSAGYGNPRRMASGIDYNRLALLIAVLEKRAGANLSSSDIYVSVAGGLKIDETAVDLGISVAVATAKSDKQIPSDLVFIGEVGLGGELRAVSQLEKRIKEAAKLGFTRAIIPKRSMNGLRVPPGFKVYGVENIRDAIKNIV